MLHWPGSIRTIMSGGGYQHIQQQRAIHAGTTIHAPSPTSPMRQARAIVCTAAAAAAQEQQLLWARGSVVRPTAPGAPAATACAGGSLKFLACWVYISPSSRSTYSNCLAVCISCLEARRSMRASAGSAGEAADHCSAPASADWMLPAAGITPPSPQMPLTLPKRATPSIPPLTTLAATSDSSDCGSLLARLFKPLICHLPAAGSSAVRPTPQPP
jgi:hypothetical protein